MQHVVEQFRGGRWQMVTFWDAQSEAEDAMARYTRNNPTGQFRVIQRTVHRSRILSPMALA